MGSATFMSLLKSGLPHMMVPWLNDAETSSSAGMLNGQPRLQPSFNVHIEFGRGAATWSGNGIAFQQKVPVTRHVGFEVKSH